MGEDRILQGTCADGQTPSKGNRETNLPATPTQPTLLQRKGSPKPYPYRKKQQRNLRYPLYRTQHPQVPYQPYQQKTWCWFQKGDCFGFEIGVFYENKDKSTFFQPAFSRLFFNYLNRFDKVELKFSNP